jgi:hypothetical protein
MRTGYFFFFIAFFIDFFFIAFFMVAMERHPPSR